MSVTICPSCLTRQFENGICTSCGFNSAEYKPGKTALPLACVVGSYRVGVLKSSSRQSQIYAAVHTETSAPVILEEFFPANMVGRVQNTTEVVLAEKDEAVEERYEWAVDLIEKSTQKRPMERKEVFRANNTIYSVFDPVPNVKVAVQCEVLADNPWYFRDQDGKPMMSINALSIPPMPQDRPYDEERYQRKSPVTQAVEIPDVTTTNQLITESVKQQKQKKHKKTVLFAGIAAALVIAAGVTGIVLGNRSNQDNTASVVTASPTTAVNMPSPTIPPEPSVSVPPEPTDAGMVIQPEKVTADTVLHGEEFTDLLVVRRVDEKTKMQARKLSDPSSEGYYNFRTPIRDDAIGLITLEEETVKMVAVKHQRKDKTEKGEYFVYYHNPDQGTSKVYVFMLWKEGDRQWYCRLPIADKCNGIRNDDGTITITKLTETAKVCFSLWTDVGDQFHKDDVVAFTEGKDGSYAADILVKINELLVDSETEYQLMAEGDELSLLINGNSYPLKMIEQAPAMEEQKEVADLPVETPVIPNDLQGGLPAQQGKPTNQQGEPADQQGEPADQQGEPSDQQGEPSDQPGEPSDQQWKRADQQGEPSDQPGEPSDQQGKRADQQGEPADQQGEPEDQQEKTNEGQSSGGSGTGNSTVIIVGNSPQTNGDDSNSGNQPSDNDNGMTLSKIRKKEPEFSQVGPSAILTILTTDQVTSVEITIKEKNEEKNYTFQKNASTDNKYKLKWIKSTNISDLVTNTSYTVTYTLEDGTKLTESVKWNGK